MKLTDLFLEELEKEAAATRRVLEQVPDGHADWKPHEKSMTMGRLSSLVATMPSWIYMMIDQDELNLTPGQPNSYEQRGLDTAKKLLEAHDEEVAKAKASLARTNEEHLMTKWRLKVHGNVVNENVRYSMIQSAVFNHWSHHRGQLTVYLRLNDAMVPAIYGPSADDARFD